MQNGTVVVTGASTGIGAATCRHLASLGFEVGLVYVARRTPRSWSRGRAGSARSVSTSPSPPRWPPLAIAVAKVPGPLRALVNNAGIAVVGPVEALRVEDWRRQLEVNVLGQVAVTRTLLPQLIDARGGLS
jgi:NADP-dependent 3-hydroxy acid dehydrogenase YdfG